MATRIARIVVVASALALLSTRFAAQSPAAPTRAAGALVRLTESGAGPVNSVAVSPDGLIVATATARANVRLWSARDGTPLAVLPAEAPPVIVQFSADGTRLAASYSDGSVRMWDPRDGSLVNRLMVHPRGVTAMALSPDGRIVAGGGEDGAIHLVDAETANLVRRIVPALDPPGGDLIPRPARVRIVAFSPDGSVLISAHDHFDPFVRVWDVRTGHEVTRLREDGAPVHSAFFSPDGATLATAAASGQNMTLWEASTWRVRRKLNCRGAPEFPHAFSADSRSLWSLTGDSMWRWALPAGRRVYRFAGEHRGRVLTAAAFPDGARVVTGGDDGTAVVWDGDTPRQSGPEQAAQTTEVRLEGLWGALAAEDAGAAYDAMGAMAAAPAQSVPYLRNRFPRFEPVDADRVEKLIAELDDEHFTVRERAMKEIALLGDAAEPILRRRRAVTTSPEAGQRIDVLLESLGQGVRDADTLRAIRATEVLEWIGTADARAALRELSGGASGAHLKARAAAALRRMDRVGPAGGHAPVKR